MKPILNPNYNLYRKDNQAYCDSLQVAETFGKEHSHVIRDIENLHCSEEFNAANFGRINYKDSRGRKQQKYIMTKDGFTFLVMGYRGKKAAQFKEAYIKRFNAMAEFITVLSEVKEDFPEFTEAVNLAHPEPKPYHYSNEVNMLCSIVLGQTVQSYRKQHNIDGSIRDYLTSEQLIRLRKLQRIDIGLLLAVPDISKRKQMLAKVGADRE